MSRRPPLERGSRASRILAATVLLGLLAGCGSGDPAYQWRAHPVGTAPLGPPQFGPTRGTLVLAGGGALGSEIWQRFVDLAGGPDGHIVVIPTASADEEFSPEWSGLDELRQAGAGQITILHTRDRDEADSADFAAPLTSATGVWIPGGRQWRLVDAYLHTRVHRELFEVLRRGGVIGGTSAGASIQASFLVRGDPASNEVMISPDYVEGFGFLNQTAVDQHLLARDRENDLWDVLRIHPDLLGIGLDEGTAIVVRGDRAEVLGESRVLIYESIQPLRRALSLGDGAVYDLRRRTVLPVTVDEDAPEATSGAAHPL